MKMIEAIIRQTALDAVQEALMQAGVQGMTVTEVRGFGREKGETEEYRGTKFTNDFVPRVKLEIVVGEDQSEDVIEMILTNAETGKVGEERCLEKIQTRTRIQGKKCQ